MKTLQGLIVFFALAMSGCAFMKPASNSNSSQALQSSGDVPAGEGTVMAREGGNGNTALTVKVKHLAPASRIEQDAQVYVVWVEPPNAPPQNVGVLSVNRNLDGTLSTITPHKKFRVVITPEQNGQVDKPNGSEVFTSDVERMD